MLEIGPYQIECLSIFLPEDDSDKIYGEGTSSARPGKNWPQICNEAHAYFKSQKILLRWTWGIHGDSFGIRASRPYLRDNPEQNWHLEWRTVAGYLSGYQILNVALCNPEWEYIALIEPDCRLVDNWRERLEKALEDAGDFDMLYAGSCCTEGRPTTHIKGEVYEVKYPLCFHFTIINTRCLSVLLGGLRDACKPWDIHLFDEVLDKLKVRTILPRIAYQENTVLPL